MEEPPMCFLWQYEHGSRWINYEGPKLEAINKAFNKGQKTVTVPERLESKQIVVFFDKMYQRNKVSGWEQRVRCCIFDKNFYVWQWKDDDNVWNCYVPAICLELETCFKVGKVAKFFFKDDYEVDFNTFKQKNGTTGVVCDVKRQKVDVGNMTASLKQVIASSTAFLKSKRKADTDEERNLLQQPILSTTDNSAKKMKVMKPKKSDESVTTYLVKGTVPVDSYCTELIGKAHVYCDGVETFDATLNLTDVVNNNNKFFHLQLLKEDLDLKYYVWFHWGRIGAKGQCKLISCDCSVEKAKFIFMDKFYAKTKNTWEEKERFEKVDGKYSLSKVDYGLKEISEHRIHNKSLLPRKIEDLLRMISDVKELTKHVVAMKYDVNKAPLGKLTQEQIRDGYLALKKISVLLRSKQKASVLVKATNEFYMKIPHNFGMKSPPLITGDEDIKEKLELLEALRNIEVAVEIQRDASVEVENAIDFLYRTLQCDLKVLKPVDEMYSVIGKCLWSTHGPTHSSYTMQVIDIFECNKPKENEEFLDYGNRALLWHGSRITNFVGILKHGLLIAPPEAPSTGYMFGKGLYFADVCSKSANYCYATQENNIGLLLLCEVSLGESDVVFSADYNARAGMEARGKQSVLAVGLHAPDPSHNVEWCGARIALGLPMMHKVEQVPELCYNEYVVYDTKQVKLKFLVLVKFIFKP